MKDVLKLLDLWYAKLILGMLITIFSPFKTALGILFIFIIIDTVLGMYYAAKIRKFTSKGFRKGIRKITTYVLIIFVIRLLEVGIGSLLQTTVITSTVTSYLIITEAISILENLILIDVPVPAGVIKRIIAMLKDKLFKDLTLSDEEKNYYEEMDDIINYQIPNIKSEKMQVMLRIKFQEWKNTLAVMDAQINENRSGDNDLVFLRLTSLINTTNNIINSRWIEEKIPKECIDAFNKCHKPKFDKWINGIKEICYSSNTIDEKKRMIMDKTMVILYQNVVDIQKGEETLAKMKVDCRES